MTKRVSVKRRDRDFVTGNHFETQLRFQSARRRRRRTVRNVTRKHCTEIRLAPSWHLHGQRQPIGSYYHYDPFHLVAVSYLAAGALAGRLGAFLETALAES